MNSIAYWHRGLSGRGTPLPRGKLWNVVLTSFPSLCTEISQKQCTEISQKQCTAISQKRKHRTANLLTCHVAKRGQLARKMSCFIPQDRNQTVGDENRILLRRASGPWPGCTP